MRRQVGRRRRAAAGRCGAPGRCPAPAAPRRLARPQPAPLTGQVVDVVYCELLQAALEQQVLIAHGGDGGLKLQAHVLAAAVAYALRVRHRPLTAAAPPASCTAIAEAQDLAGARGDAWTEHCSSTAPTPRQDAPLARCTAARTHSNRHSAPLPAFSNCPSHVVCSVPQLLPPATGQAASPSGGDSAPLHHVLHSTSALLGVSRPPLKQALPPQLS